jgi:hypothetical protein
MPWRCVVKLESASGDSKATARWCIPIIGVEVVAACLLAVPPAAAQENCCLRKVWTAPFTLPPGDAVNWSMHFASAFDDAFHQVLAHSRCPVIVKFSGDTINHDYRFVGVVSPEGRAQAGADGNLRGTFTETVRLIDPDHGDAVLREARVSWTGMLKEGLNHQVSQYEPSTNSRNQSWVNPTGELSKQFLDIDALIYDYERKPQLCRITLEGSSSTIVQAGETVTVRLSEIFDHQSRPSQTWQRIVIHPDKGRLLNCTRRSQNPDDCVFEAGSGTFEFAYQAPDNCKISTDTLTVYNSCEKRSRSHPLGDTAPEETIATKTFDVTCDRWDVKITYTEDLGGTYEAAKGHKITVQRNYSGTFKARVKLIKNDGRTATYESKDAEAQIHDNYNHHSVMEECAWRGGFNGDKSGRVPIEVTFRLNTHNHTYHVGLGKWSGDGMTYTLGGNLFGTLEGCSGAWQQEISSIVLPRGWEKGEGPPSSRAWAPGQTSFTFQTSWDDYMTGIWPQGAPGPPPMLSGMVPAAYRLTYVTAVFDWGRNPNMKIKKTLSWEVTRPK